ncbi:MAG: hypothetical protein KA964_15610, partial [Comamonas sp.]|nr:hypothetical protein [Comamonas sp.]
MSYQDLDWDRQSNAMGNFLASPPSTPALQNPAFLGFARTTESTTEMEKRPLRPENDTPLRGVRSNIVQSIRAFHIPDLQKA